MIKLSRKLCKTQREGRRGAPPLGEEVRCKIAGEWAYELGGVAPTKLAPLQHAGTQTPIAMPPPSSINKINQSINPLPFPPFLFPVFKTWWVYSCSSIIVCAPYHLLSTSVLTWWIHALSLSLSLSLRQLGLSPAILILFPQWVIHQTSASECIPCRLLGWHIRMMTQPQSAYLQNVSSNFTSLHALSDLISKLECLTDSNLLQHHRHHHQPFRNPFFL